MFNLTLYDMKYENNVLVWLRRIFTLKTCSIFLAAISAFFAYKTYSDSKSPELVVRIPSTTSHDDFKYEFHEVQNISKYWSLLVTDIPIVGINDIYHSMPIGSVLTFPEFINTSDKSLLNFICEIDIWWEDTLNPVFNYVDTTYLRTFNDRDYEITKYDQRAELRYKHNYLPSNSYLPDPLFILKLLHVGENFRQGDFSISYSIRYDGLRQPYFFDFDVRLYLLREEDGSVEDISKDRLNNLTVEYLNNYVFTNLMRNKKYSGEWAIIINNHLYRDIKHLTTEEFKNGRFNSILDLQK